MEDLTNGGCGPVDAGDHMLSAMFSGRMEPHRDDDGTQPLRVAAKASIIFFIIDVTVHSVSSVNVC